MTVLEYPSIADPKLVKNKDIPCHSPKIEDKQPNSLNMGNTYFMESIRLSTSTISTKSKIKSKHTAKIATALIPV